MQNTAWVIMSIILVVVLVGGGILLFGGSSTAMATSGSQVKTIPSTNTQTATQTSDTSGQNSQQNSASSGKTYMVNIKSFAFTPQTLSIQKGDTVVWTNMDSAPHTVTSDSGNQLASQTLSNGQTYSQTFDQVGTFAYHCSVHPMMTGTIIVGDNGASTSNTGSSTTTTTSSGSGNMGSSGGSGYY